MDHYQTRADEVARYFKRNKRQEERLRLVEPALDMLWALAMFYGSAPSANDAAVGALINAYHLVGDFWIDGESGVLLEAARRLRLVGKRGLAAAEYLVPMLDAMLDAVRDAGLVEKETTDE